MRKQLLLLGGLVGLAATAVYRLRRRIFQHLLGLTPVENETAVTANIRIPMPDGVTLTADHYYPGRQPPGIFRVLLTRLLQRILPFTAHRSPVTVDRLPKAPTILMRTPYGRGNMNRFQAQRFAERGYHVLVQDTRGRFDADGDFTPRYQERDDGLATLAWIRNQPWSNGVVGMWGQSYLGMVQWAVAVEDPPELQAIVPAITTAKGAGLFYPQGVFTPQVPLRWLVMLHAMNPLRLPGVQRWSGRQRFRNLLPSGTTAVLAPHYRHLPAQEIDQKAVGTAVPFYQHAIAHPPGDSSWQPVEYHDRLDQVTAPAHFISGWYDFLLYDLLDDYVELARHAAHTPYLTIGPWHHFAQRGMVANLRQGLAWFDAHLRRRERRRNKPVRVFVMGAGEWRDFDAWPPPSRPHTLYLQPNGRLAADTPTANAAPSRYRYDPADPTPSVGGPIFRPDAGRVDNTALEARPDVLTFTSAPLPDDFTLIGAAQAEFYVNTSADSADFFARLCEVDENGRSWNVCDGITRITPDGMTPGQGGALRVSVDLWATAYCFRRGRRLRLQISSGAFPRWARNLGTTEPPATATHMVAARQTVYHDGERPSALTLPQFTA